VVDERSLFLISGGGDLSDWVRNLLAGPQATVRIGDRVLKARARLPLPVGAEREKAVRALHAKYGNQASRGGKRAFVPPDDPRHPHHHERPVATGPPTAA
jgi:hypothetical protein